MKIFKRLKYSLMQQGLSTTISKFYMLVVDSFFDLRYGTDTSKWIRLSDLKIESDNKTRGVDYHATRVEPLRRLFEKIKTMIPVDSVFVDFGCGKGRAMLIASNFGFREVRGVEFAHELCEIAKKNCVIYKSKMAVKAEFQIIKSDVVDYCINTDENVFFLFQPFDEVVLKELLSHIITSLRKHSRKILIIYNTPIYGNFIEQQDNFVKSGEFVLLGNKFTLYSNFD